MQSVTQPGSERVHRLGTAFRQRFAYARDEKVAFLVVNVAVNLLILLRSYITMRVLDYPSLGLVTVMQSIMLLVGTMQFGVINGAYRLLCSESDESAGRINNVVYSCIGVIAAVAVGMCAVALPFSSSARVAAGIALGVVGGVLALLRSWVTNQMTAKVLLSELNRATVASAIASMLMLVFVPLAPLAACLAAIVIQPLAFVVQLLVNNRALRPTGFALPRALLARILASGFTLFLTGILTQVNNQLERWYVATYVGLDALGHLYLTILFVSMFQLVPSSLDSVFLPRLVGAHIAGRVGALQRDLRHFLGVLAAYCAVVVVAVWVLAPAVVGTLLPKYVPDLQYVRIVLPGLLLFAVSSPFASVFNVLIRYRTLLVAYGIGSAATAMVFGGALAGGWTLSLAEVSVLRSVVYALMAAVLGAGWLRLSRSDPTFHFVRRS